jgi:hypothetical protein
MNMIKMIWTQWWWQFELKKSGFFCSSVWTYERQGALQIDLPNCCVSFTWQSLSMLWRSAREHCDGADGARHAHKFYFCLRISYRFPISDCRGDSDLGLRSSWHLAAAEACAKNAAAKWAHLFNLGCFPQFWADPSTARRHSSRKVPRTTQASRSFSSTDCY